MALSSDRIDLGSGTKKAINNFLVRNTGDIDLYQVTIKLLLESTTLSVTNDDIGVEMIDSPANAAMPIRIPGDPFNQVLAACISMVLPGRDFANRESLWIVIDHLAPKASAGFRIRNQSFKCLPPGEHCLRTSVAFYTNTLQSTFMFDDGAPGFAGPSSGSIGMKSLGPGKGRLVASAHVAPIDGADMVSNATCLIELGKWDDAERQLTLAVERNPSLGVAYGNRAVVKMRQAKIEDAYQDSMKALSLLPDDPLAHAHVAQCLLLLRRSSEALTNYNRAIALAGTNMPGLLYERGQVLSDLNRPGEARKDFDEAIILGCANEQSYYGRGLAFLNEQSFSNAVSDLSIAITKRPDMAEAYFVRGIAFGRLGQLGLADKDIREAIRLNPSITNVFRMQ